MIPQFLDLLNKMKDIHEKKNQDYAQTGAPFENFERSGQLASWFNDPIDKGFTVLIGTKLARLATLLNSDKTPNNESIDDSFLDLTTYCALWASYRIKRNTEKRIGKQASASIVESQPLMMTLGRDARIAEERTQLEKPEEEKLIDYLNRF